MKTLSKIAIISIMSVAGLTPYATYSQGRNTNLMAYSISAPSLTDSVAAPATKSKPHFIPKKTPGHQKAW